MKLPITITYTDGKAETYTANPPEWMKWETKTGKTIQDAREGVGISDLLFLAYHAMKREAAGSPVKPFEAWAEGVTDIQVGDTDTPKAIDQEA